MKLSQSTISILKTFASINSNILLSPGKTLTTIAVAQNIFANAVIDEEIPNEFGIYNLAEFLGAISLFKEPEIKFSEKFVTISDAQNTSYSLKYVGADKTILVFPEREVKIPQFDVEFPLSNEQLSAIQKGATVIGAPDILVNGSESGLFLKVCDRKNPLSNDFSIQVSDQPQVSDFSFPLKVENIKLIPGDHVVSISPKGTSRWFNAAAKTTVFVALEK